MTARRPDGFTLIELMVVMGIIAALLAIALPQFYEYTRRTENKAAQADTRNLLTQVSVSRTSN